MDVRFLYYSYSRFHFSVRNEIVLLSNLGRGNYNIGPSSDRYISELLESAVQCMEVGQSIKFIFEELGLLNTLRLFQASCNQEFLKYYRKVAKDYINQPFNRGIREFIFYLTGYKSSLKNADGLIICQQMKSSYELISQKRVSKTYRKITKIERFQDIKQDGIKISCVDFNNNYLSICVNDYCFSLKVRHADSFTTEEFHKKCLSVRSTIIKQEDLSSLVNSLGSVLLYNIMYAVCPAETLKYFKRVADDLTAKRERIQPVKLLKSMKLGYRANSSTSPILVNILDLLETESKNQIALLLSGNAEELQKHSEWKIYFRKHTMLYFYVYRFDVIQNQLIADEVRAYLRAKADLIDLENSHSLLRIYYDLIDGISALLTDNLADKLNSITEISYIDALHMRACLVQSKRYSVSSLSEIICYMDNLFLYTAITKNVNVESPFIDLRVKKKKNYVTITEPISEQALGFLYRKFDDLPRVVKIAFLTYLEMGVRGDDVCSMVVSDLKDDIIPGKKHLHLTLSKTGLQKRACNKTDSITREITNDLYKMIENYIEDYAELRQDLDTDLVLVYPEMNKREGSKLLARVLTSATFNYQINLILKSYNVRKFDGSLETANSRQIRAAFGRRLFKAGKSATEVASNLGNTPLIAASNYNKMTLLEECESFNNLYNESFVEIFLDAKEKDMVIQEENQIQVMYGNCNKKLRCNNQNDCRTCNLIKKMTN